MKIGLYNLEPSYKNLALEKIRVYYESHNHIVNYISPLEYDQYDTTYCSSIFDFTNKQYVPNNMIKGGTGFDITTTLPPEIDTIEPHINLGFTTRGCNNKCPPCVVWKKEGVFKIVGDIKSLWDGKGNLIILLDNDILFSPEHFEYNAKQAIKYNLKLDYNQGLDHRLLTPEIVDIMKSFKHKEFRFAFDNPKYIDTVDKAITLLQSKGINRCSWYVLVGYNTTPQEDLMRVNYLRSRNQNAYIQRFKDKQKKNDKNIFLITLGRWVNQHRWFQATTFEQFIDNPKHKNISRIVKYIYTNNITAM